MDKFFIKLVMIRLLNKDDNIQNFQYGALLRYTQTDRQTDKETDRIPQH